LDFAAGLRPGFDCDGGVEAVLKKRARTFLLFSEARHGWHFTKEMPENRKRGHTTREVPDPGWKLIDFLVGQDWASDFDVHTELGAQTLPALPHCF